MSSTSGDEYAERLVHLSSARWKRVLQVQAPYRWNLRRRGLGRTLDIGCGIGRNLSSLPPGSVGVDHNPASVRAARRQGLVAFTTDEWASQAPAPGSFDSLLLAHVVEHMDFDAARDLVEQYLPFLRVGGRVLVICPQERGYATDETHVEWYDAAAITRLLDGAGLETLRSTSFPLPRAAGRFFTYNEFNVEARKAPPATIS